MKQFIKKRFIFAFLLVLIYACQKNSSEELFNESATNRLNKKIIELRTALKSSPNGWKVTYFTDNKMLGGYTFLFNFLDDENVKMNSDFSNDENSYIPKSTKEKTSKYNILMGSTLKLSFTTKNYIHELADPNTIVIESMAGKGYKGDFEFLYYGKDGEDLLFRTNKKFIKLRFKKATAKDWTDFTKNREMLNNLLNSSKRFIYKIGDKEYNFSYDDRLRFCTNVEEDKDKNFGVGFSQTGIIIDPAIDVNGVKQSEFTLSNDKKQLVSLDGKFIIYILSPPFNIEKKWSTVADATNLSSSLLTIFNQIESANVATYSSEELKRVIYFGTIEETNSIGVAFFSEDLDFGGSYAIAYNLKLLSPPMISNILNISKDGGGENWSYYGHLLPYIDAIVDNSPYKIEKNNPTNPTEIKLISTKDSNIWFIIKL